MGWYKNLKISKKLILGFLFVAIIAAIVGVVGVVSITRINNADHLLFEENVIGLQYSGAAATDFQRVRFNSTKLSIAETKSEKDSYMAKIEEQCGAVDAALVSYEKTISTDEGRVLYDITIAEWAEYRSSTEQLVKYIDTDQLDKHPTFMAEIAVVGDALREDFIKLTDLNVAKANTRAESNGAQAQTAIIIMVIAIAAGLFLSMFLGIAISRMIANPLNKIAGVADKLALGDVNVEIDVTTKDEVGMLALAFKKLIESTREQVKDTQMMANGDLTVEVNIRSEHDLLGKGLSSLVKSFHELAVSIVGAADQVAAGSNLVSNSSMVLSQGATEQASAVEELTASLEEIASQTNLNAQNADKAQSQRTDQTFQIKRRQRQRADEGNAQGHG